MKIFIVSGFLGAGKTTFIQYLAKRLGRRFVILENEYGEADIDTDRLKASAEDIWALTEGCICCSVKGDFAASVLSIANALEPDYLVIEPTGVGQLSSILANLTRIEYERIQLLEPIALVDAKAFAKTKEEFEEILEDQVQCAENVIITKTNELSLDMVDGIKKAILKVKNGGNVITEPYETLDDDFFKKLLETPWHGSAVATEVEPPTLETMAFTDFRFRDAQAFHSFMAYLIRGDFGNIVRAKGNIPVGDDYVRFDWVEGEWEIVPQEAHDSRMVFIGSELKQGDLETLFSYYSA